MGSTTTWGSGLTWAARSDLSLRAFDAVVRSRGVKQGTCQEGWRQKGSMQLDSVHGLETFLGGSITGGEDLRRVGLAEHLSDKSKSESMM